VHASVETNGANDDGDGEYICVYELAPGALSGTTCAKKASKSWRLDEAATIEVHWVFSISDVTPIYFNLAISASVSGTLL
jgi:hypothetical protein